MEYYKIYCDRNFFNNFTPPIIYYFKNIDNVIKWLENKLADDINENNNFLLLKEKKIIFLILQKMMKLLFGLMKKLKNN